MLRILFFQERQRIVKRLRAGFFLLLTLALPAKAADELSTAAAKPNFLFILVDDYGIMDVGAEGSTFYETPNIDQFARSGMRFTQGYAACPVCSPSRASILTGQYPPRHGITDYIGAATGDVFAKERLVKLSVPDYARQLSKSQFTLAQALKQAGYSTFFTGKWHLGGKGFWPENFGFDINKGGWDAGSPIGGYFAPWTNPSLPNGPKGQSLTDRMATETISFIEQHRNGPFLAYLAFYAVHAPIQTTKPLWEEYRSRAAGLPTPHERFQIDRTLPVRQVQDNPIYGGLVESMDTAVGRVLGCLHNLGLETNTIVIFTSDNGGVSSGDSYSSSMLPYRGGKGRQWEGGLRVPLYVRAPGVTTPGSTCDTPVSGIDFYPTMLDLAGVPMPAQQTIDGVSVVPLLAGGGINDRPLFWHYPHYGNQGGEPSSIIREDGWKLIHYWEDNRNELYHLAADIGEQHDLALQEAQRTARLWAELQAWLNETGAKIPRPYAYYDHASAGKLRLASKQLKGRLEQQHADYLKPDWQPDPTWWKSLVTKD